MLSNAKRPPQTKMLSATRTTSRGRTTTLFISSRTDRSVHSRGLSIGEAPLPSPKRGRSRNLTRSGERWLLLALLRELLPESRTAPRPRVQHFDALPAPGAGAPPEDDRRREADEARAGQDHRLQIPPELDLAGDDH